MIDKKAFRSMSYGLYVIGAKSEDGKAGCVVNTLQQVTSEPLQVSVALNKENATTQAVRRSGRFTAACLSEAATMELIGVFGFHTSADTDKFAQCAVAEDSFGVPYVNEQTCARFSAKVVQEVDLGTHMLFVGEVEEAEAVPDAEPPMTYAYYHAVKGGKTPPKASSYLGEGPAAPKAAESAADGAKPKYAWRCTICGHIEYVDELPDDFVCPICGMGKEMFERIEVE